MAVRNVLMYPADEALLRKKSEPVTAINDEIRALAQDLIDTLAEHPGAGLAAPQIGVHKRMCVVRFGQDDKKEMDPPLVLINPEVVKSGDLATGFDGCLSIPNLITWETPRPAILSFSALTVKGKKIRKSVSGIDARLVHHEIDHLDGILFLDRLQDMRDLYYQRKGPDGKMEAIPFAEFLAEQQKQR